MSTQRKPDYRYLAAGGILFLVFGVFLHFVLHIHRIAQSYSFIGERVPARALEFLAFLDGTSTGTEFMIRALALAVATLLIERAFVGWEDSSARSLFRGENRVRRDLVFTILCAVQAYPILSAVSSFGVTYFVASALGSLGRMSLLHFVPSVILQLVLLVLMRSLAIYWQHRLAHAVPFLWQFHKFHHSASVMTGLNDYRGTPLTIAMTGSWVLVVAQLFGSVDASRGGLATAVAAFLFMVFRFATELNAHVIHSRVDSTYGWFGRFVFASPGYHRIHHSALPEHRDRNFCTDFVLWDWLFGTQVDPKYVTDRANIPLGFDDNPYDRGSLVYDYFFRPARDAIASLRPGATRNRVTATGNPAA